MLLLKTGFPPLLPEDEEAVVEMAEREEELVVEDMAFPLTALLGLAVVVVLLPLPPNAFFFLPWVV